MQAGRFRTNHREARAVRVAPRVKWRQPRGRTCAPVHATIDVERPLLAAVRWSIRKHGDEPSSRKVDQLLDERSTLTGS